MILDSWRSRMGKKRFYRVVRIVGFPWVFLYNACDEQFL